jgi:hypothetical protein
VSNVNRNAIFIISITLILALAGQVACAQSTSPASGTIHGYVTDVNGKNLATATVSLYGENAQPGAPGMTSVTDANGYYVFNNVPAGNYSLQATRDYFASTTTTHVSGGDNSLNLVVPVK